MLYKNCINIESEEVYYEKICAVIINEAIANIKSKGNFTFAISGGKSPKYIFNKLTTNRFVGIDWSKVSFFWVDERVVSSNSDENNYELANEYLFSKLTTNPKIFKINVDTEINSSILLYEKIIFENVHDRTNGLPSFDLVLLGMGEDGHIASIFSNLPSYLTNRYVFTSGLMHNGFFRISLGFPLINNSKRILLLVNNKAKLEIFYKNEQVLPVHKINLSITTIFIHEK
jgi:6-phosphogluconolactonase